MEQLLNEDQSAIISDGLETTTTTKATFPLLTAEPLTIGNDSSGTRSFTINQDALTVYENSTLAGYLVVKMHSQSIPLTNKLPWSILPLAVFFFENSYAMRKV